MSMGLCPTRASRAREPRYKIPPARIFDTFDKFLTVDLRLYFPGEQPKPQFPASKIFSVELHSFSGSIPPKFEHKPRRHKHDDLEKFPPQLY